MRSALQDYINHKPEKEPHQAREQYNSMLKAVRESARLRKAQLERTRSHKTISQVNK